MRWIPLLLALGLFAAPPAVRAEAQADPAEAKGLDIARRADARDRGWIDATADLSMVLTNKAGDTANRSLDFRALEVNTPGDGDKSLVVFKAPKDVADTALLTFARAQGNDDQWIYLPALKRVKRIASSNRSGPFMGSEFAYEDLAAYAVEKFRYRWLRDEPCGVANLTCHVVERVPVYEGSGYARQVAWLDVRELRVVRTDYFDQRNMLLKTMKAGKWAQYDGRYWRAHDLYMVNHQTGKTTRLVWGRFTLHAGLKSSDFSEASLAR